MDLMTKLLYLGIDCQYYTDYYLQRISASSLHQDDTVIAISYSGQSKDVVDTVKIAKKSRGEGCSYHKFWADPSGKMGRCGLKKLPKTVVIWGCNLFKDHADGIDRYALYGHYFK